MSLFFKSIRRFYGIENVRIEECDVVVPLGYGLNKLNYLPLTEQMVLTETRSIAHKKNARIAWASSNYFGPNSADVESGLKKAVFPDFDHIIDAGGITNSVVEARAIQNMLDTLSVPHRHITIVCDWPHARSALIIWRQVFPESKITIHSVEGHWDDSNVAILQRSNLLWLIACLLRHVALRIMGIEWVARQQHPLQK